MIRTTTWVVFAVAFSLIFVAGSENVFRPAIAQEVAEEEQQLLIPEDLTVKENQNFELQELRVGGRLERVTVKWNNGVTEVYQNKRNDTIWSAEESQLGDGQNVRQWRLGSW